MPKSNKYEKYMVILDRQQEIMNRISRSCLAGQIVGFVGLVIGKYVELESDKILLLMLMLTAIQVVQMVICVLVCQITSTLVLGKDNDR